MNRFGDIDCSFKKLPAVFGYHVQKIVSLEKSLEEIQNQILGLDYFIKVAKRRCHFPSEHGLTRDQSASIYIYIMEWGPTSLYRILNKALLDENRNVFEIWFSYLKLLDSALEKLPKVKEEVRRGVPLNNGQKFIENQLLTWWTVNSCSSSVKIIKKFRVDGEFEFAENSK